MGATALAMAREYEPQAITLDIHLPDIEGWRVLDRLKHDTATRHIPICVISTDESQMVACLGSDFVCCQAITKLRRARSSADHIDGQLIRSMKRLLLVAPEGDDRENFLLDAVGDNAEINRITDFKQA